MKRGRDFYFLEVLNIKGKKVGSVMDLLLDFNNEKIIGFSISSNNIFKKNMEILMEDIMVLNDSIIVKKISKNLNYVKFQEIKHMDIIDRKGIIIGVLEEILINEKDFSIKGMVICPGIFTRLFKGKNILLLKNCILGEKNILYTGHNNLEFKALPNYSIGVNNNEKL